MNNLTDIEKQVILKLARRRVFGSKHIRLDTLLKCGWKPHEKDLVKKAVKSLINKGMVSWVKKEKKALHLNKLIFLEE